MAPALSILPAYPYAPYCGAPPGPDGLWLRWNLDPLLLAALFVALLAYAAVAEPGLWGRARLPRWRRLAFYGGWAVGALAVISPLCPLSVALFSARVGQHMILAMAAAPLVTLGRPGVVFVRAFSRREFEQPRLSRRLPGGPLAAAAVFAVVLWLWHAPGPYAATFKSDLVYWLMHLTTFGAACWLWTEVLNNGDRRLGAVLAATLGTAIQMGLLGSVLTFATRPLYGPHALTTWAFGLAPLQDQQLGGVIMWVPAGAILVGAIVGAMAVALRQAELARPSLA